MSSATRLRIGVGATYAAQGFGYATAVTALPGLKDRIGMDDAVVSLVVLLGCLTAAAGSVAAEKVAVRLGSHASLLLGLGVQVIGLPLVAWSTSVPMVMVTFAVYGLGLGTVDAASAMQGVQLQHRLGTSVLSTLFACYTGAAIVAALSMSVLANLGTGPGAQAGLMLATVVVAAVIASARGSLVPSAPPVEETSSGAGKLPTRGIWLFGTMILVAFVADSAVSTWSSVYLHDSLHSGAVIAPLGYAAYQASILVTRLAGDRLVARHGRARTLVPAVSAAIVGLAAVSVLSAPAAVVVAFGVAGVGVGVLVPLTFSAAGELAPERVHEVIARINLFNYAGAVVGAVTLGLLSAWPGLGVAFIVPAVLLIPALVVARKFDHPRGRAVAPVDSGLELG